MANKFQKYYQTFLTYLKYNCQFVSYVILALLCCVLLRTFTIGNFIHIKPIIMEISIIVLLGSFTYLNKPQKQFTYLFVLLIVYTTICVINNIYYEFYSSYASFSLITALGQVGEVGGAVFEKMRVHHYIYILAPITFFFIHKKLKNKGYFTNVAKFEKNKQLYKSVFLTGLALVLFSFITSGGVALSRLVKQWDREYIVGRYGVVLYQVNDLINTLKPSFNSMFGYDIALKEVTDYFDNNAILPSNNEYTNIFKDKNVIFIHMESMTNFLMDLIINDVEITPNLNKLSQEGIFFKNFYPEIGVGTSSDTEFTLNTSLMPATSGTVFISYYDRYYITLPKLLAEKGYYTYSMHGNKANMWNRNIMHPRLGYMDFYSKSSFIIDETVGLGISDKSFFRQSIAILENIEINNDKYMGTIITLSNHTPFDNSELFNQIDLTYHGENTYDYLEGTKLGDFIRSAHYADQAMGEFISYINESQYFDNTVFIFYGDHDPKLALSEYYNYYNFNPINGRVLNKNDNNYIPYDYYSNELNKKTPLIIWSKNKKYNQTVDYYMGMIDLMPTIGNMLGLYNEYALGKDIFEIKDNNIIPFPNGNFLTNKVYFNNAKNEYKALSLEDVLSEEYINDCLEKTGKIISVSNNIIVHDLIKKEKENEIND